MMMRRSKTRGLCYTGWRNKGRGVHREFDARGIGAGHFHVLPTTRSLENPSSAVKKMPIRREKKIFYMLMMRIGA